MLLVCLLFLLVCEKACFTNNVRAKKCGEEAPHQSLDFPLDRNTSALIMPCGSSMG